MRGSDMDKKEKNISFIWLKFIPVLLVVGILCTVLGAGPFSKEQGTRYKNHYNPAYDYITEPENTIDIACIGSSDIFTSFCPQYLFEEYGYTAVDIGMSYQTPTRSYYFLEDLLKTQSPKVLILDTDMLYEHFPTKAGIEEINAQGEKSAWEKFTDRQEKFFARFSDSRFSDIITSYFTIFQFNDHWKQTKYFMPGELIGSYTKEAEYPCEHGFKCNTDVVAAKKSPYLKETDTVEEIDDEYMIYYQKIIDLCKEKGIEVILVESPSVRSWSYQRHNAAQIIADENELEFIDFNFLLDEINLNLKKDFSDGKNHLNYEGAKKMTAYLGDKFRSEGLFTDKRNDPDYEYYAKSVEEFKEKYEVK